MDNSRKISGIIITYNEEKNIKELLQNIDFVDEIVIIDSYSKDNTKEIALQNKKVNFI
jgi:glycosyltransferase involved in cell wall biosynthesis